jgi:hypothetical protein
VVYTNRAIIFAKSRWGKIYFHEAYEDTQKVVAFDGYLRGSELQGHAGPALPASAVSSSV